MTKGSLPEGNLHLDEVKRYTDIPSRQRLIRMWAEIIFSLHFTFIQPRPDPPLITATLGPEHQRGRRDPEEENDGFGHEAECGARGRAAGEEVRGEVVRHQGVDGEGEGEDCGDDCNGFALVYMVSLRVERFPRCNLRLRGWCRILPPTARAPLMLSHHPRWTPASQTRTRKPMPKSSWTMRVK